ncbi:hypothetical protein [Neptunomonas japonica]|uniref:hypothetical protein n=1 Tax=Neptunomonas japonica TaxID=417574 RepID=UPI0003F837C3|nr:hypothetical protein [Neptunomonas japonica]
MSDKLEPIITGDFHCDPSCPFMADGGSENIDGLCKRDNKPLDWYDYYIAHCLEGDGFE